MKCAKLNWLEMKVPRISDRLKWRRSALLFGVGSLIIVADQVTKWLVRANMGPDRSIPAEGRFRLSYSTNEGSVFGLPLNTTFLTVMAIIVAVAIIWVYFSYLKSPGRVLRIGLGLIMGGAVGNLIDRVRFGEVTDFIDVRLWGNFHWATFNIADAALTIGIIVLICGFLQTRPLKNP